MDITPEESAQQAADFIAYRHRVITRQPLEISPRSAENRPTMIKIDSKISDMRDEQFIKAMMNIG